MKKKIIAALLVLVTFVMMLSACGNSSSPEKTAETFFAAVKSGDIDKAIGCYTPVIQEQYKAGISIANSIFNIDSSTLLNAILGTANANAYVNYDFKVVGSAKTDDERAVVSVDVYVDGSKKMTTNLQCVEIGGEWYIEK